MVKREGEDSNIISVDIETTGLDPWTDVTTCVGYYSANQNGVLRGELMQSLNQFAPGPIVGHNFKFDYKFLSRIGVVVDNWEHCTQLMAHICTDKVPESYIEYYERLRVIENKKLPQGVTHRQARGLSLKVLAPYFLGIQPFWEDPSNHDDDTYVLKDCEYTLRLFHLFSKKLKAQGSWEFYRKQFSKVKMLARMELKGIKVNFDNIGEVEQEYVTKRESIRLDIEKLWAKPIEAYWRLQKESLELNYSQKCHIAIDKLKDKTKAPRTEARYKKLYHAALTKLEQFNLSSPAQMAWLLHNVLGYDICDNEGVESTKKSVLNRLAKEGKQDVATYLKWREADKVLTMYIPTYKTLQHQGVIHPTFNPTGTRTGRLSSSGPNLQQVPSKLYKLFKPRDGHTFLQHDLAGIEAALIALYSGDKNLFKILSEGESIHNYNAITFFNLKCKPSEVPDKYPKERKTAKTIGFALFYGAGFKRIKESFLVNGYEITDNEAKAKLKAFRKFYSGALEFHKGITEIFEDGGVVNNLFGRPVKIQDWENPYMNGFNTLIQSSASDLNIRACEKAEVLWKERGLKSYPLLLVHDFILAECSKEDAAAADKILVKAMTDFKLKNELGVIKLAVDGGISDEWSK